MIEVIFVLISEQLKRQHSAEVIDSPSPAPAHRKSPPPETPTAGSTSPATREAAPPLLPNLAFDKSVLIPSETIGSPLKKQRASLSGMGDEDMRKRFEMGALGVKADVVGAIEQDTGANSNNVGPMAQDSSAFGGQLGTNVQASREGTTKAEDMDEEL